MPYPLNHKYFDTIKNYHHDCDYHVCRNFMETASPNRFTREGVEQMEKAVRERNSAGDMTQLELKINY
jgi:hypothetical protein